ncbi:hypothetical protein PIB30_024764 [Stylosanthes scabra]|uniref:Uncharacterized protein n=1 Tax=Stylosanthes scabra TaxID=79078 RepID=A0ABU6U9B4_9FABA|nr:hypothetical protein [Stylosanthes scabra]
MAYAESIQVYDPELLVYDPELLVPNFINGLQLQICGQVISKRPKPKTMLQAWFSARMCEIKLEEEEQADPEIPTTIPEIQHNSESEILHINNNSTNQAAKLNPAKSNSATNAESAPQEAENLDLQLECPNLVPTSLDAGTSSLDGDNRGVRSPNCEIGADITTLASNSPRSALSCRGRWCTQMQNRSRTS